MFPDQVNSEVEVNIEAAFDVQLAEALHTVLTEDEHDELGRVLNDIIDGSPDVFGDGQLSAEMRESIHQLATFAFVAGRNFQTEENGITLTLPPHVVATYIQFLTDRLEGGAE